MLHCHISHVIATVYLKRLKFGKDNPTFIIGKCISEENNNKKFDFDSIVSWDRLTNMINIFKYFMDFVG